MGYRKIILISLDTLRADCIPCNPNKIYPREYKVNIVLKNSVFNEVCKKGCFFNNVISAAPYTSSSHAAYFTGLWPKNNGLYDQFNSKLKTKNIFEIFKSSGYRTIFKTDFPFILGKYLNMTNGVDDYFIEDEEKALGILKKSKKSLCFFHFGRIHYPYGFHSLRFAENDYKKKVNQLERKYNLNTERINLEDMAVETFRSKEDLEYLYRYKKIISFLYGNKLDDVLFNLYLEGINYFHKNKFNNFLNKMQALLKGEDYLLVIFSDHGEAWNDVTYGHHNSLDEGVIKVPLFFMADNLKSKMFQNRIRTVDLAPTLIELAGIKSGQYFDGKSLVDILCRNKREDNRPAFSSVWVNKSEDVLKNMKDLKKNDRIENDRKISVKYAACYYEKNYKYVENYKIFSNRSSDIVPYKQSELYSIEKLNCFKKVSNEKMAKSLSRKLRKLNNIVEGTDSISTNYNLRKYFNLQGYNV